MLASPSRMNPCSLRLARQICPLLIFTLHGRFCISTSLYPNMHVQPAASIGCLRCRRCPDRYQPNLLGIFYYSFGSGGGVLRSFACFWPITAYQNSRVLRIRVQVRDYGRVPVAWKSTKWILFMAHWHLYLSLEMPWGAYLKPPPPLPKRWLMLPDGGAFRTLRK